MGRNLADGGATPRSIASRPATPPPRNFGSIVKHGGGGAIKAPLPQKTTIRSTTGPTARRAAVPAPSKWGNIAKAGMTGAIQGAAQPAPPPPVESFGGSGRSRGFNYGSAGSYGGAGGGGGGAAPVSAVATGVAPPPAAVQPPPVVNPAGPGAGNVAGAAFDKVGLGTGTYGQEQRRRQARGPMTGLSMTPEMLRRAASQRIG